MLQLAKKTRLLFWTGALALTIGLALGGCGAGNEAGESATSQVSPSAAAVSPSAAPSEAASPEKESPSAAATKKVTDDLGREVEVPVSPQRIVAGEFATELLALGVKPIAAGDNAFKVVFTQQDMQGVETIGDPPNPEKILELKPDLVIASTVFAEIYPEQMDQISKIAPVYYLSYDQDPIYDIFRKVADLVGRTTEADAWISGYEQEAAAARETLKTALGDETVTIFRVEKGRLRIYLNRNFGGYMLRTALAVKAPDKVATEIAGNKFGSAVQISLEQLPEYAGDHIFLIVRGEGDDKAAFGDIEQSGVWTGLDAVKNGNVHYLDTDKYYGSDVTTIRETMKEAVAMLNGTAAK